MTTLVTGGAGFIGSHLCRHLLDRGEDVLCIDNFVTGRRLNLKPLIGHPRFTVVESDLTGRLPNLPPLDRVYHLASPASPPAYQRNPLQTMAVNADGTRWLLEAAVERGARFLFASSSEVYGDAEVHPQHEGYWGNVNPVGPRAMYVEAKRYGEALVSVCQRSMRADARIARIFNTYGPNMDPDDGRVVSNFIVQALTGRPLTIYGDGSQTRSFQYIDDLVAGLVALMEGGYPGPVNLGNPVEFTMRELASLVLELTGSTSPVEEHPLPGDDPARRQPDISLAKQELGWEPTVPLRAGLERTIAWFTDVLAERPVARC